MSFFLIRLLQSFSHMEMDLAAQPPDARPPAEWARAEGQKGREQVVARTHVTMYVHVSIWFTRSRLRPRNADAAVGRVVGSDDGGGARLMRRVRRVILCGDSVCVDGIDGIFSVVYLLNACVYGACLILG